MKPWPTVRLGEVVTSAQRAEAPMPGTTYRQIGVKLWGEGAYERETMDGSQTKYAQLFSADTGDIIVNKIWARNGSVAVVPASLAGCFGSGEFPMFAPKLDRLESRWMHWLTKTRGFWAQCDEKSQGTSGKNRIKPEQFLNVEIPLPPLAEQRRVVTRIEELAAQIHEARTLRHQAAEEAEALVLSARAKQLEEAPSEREELFDSIVDQIRGSSGLPLKEYQQSGRFPVIDQGQQFIGGYCDDESRLLRVNHPVVVWGDHTTNVKLVNFDFVAGADGTKVFLPKEFVLATFLFHVLKAVKYPELGYSRHYRILKDVMVRIPALPEQRRIVAELDALQAEVDALKRLQAETAKELDALLPAILDRAFKGEL